MTNSPYSEDNVPIRVPKLAGAIRQLECAIELWFEDRDVVSVHALAAAAHQIIHDLHYKRCPDKKLLFDATWVREEKRKEFINIIKGASNSFKHADWHPNEIAEFTPIGTLLFFMVSIQGLSNLGERVSSTQNALIVWLALHRPNYANMAFVDLIAKKFPREQIAMIRRIKKREFLEYMRQASAKFPGGSFG